jgi:hypothetical protein
MSDHTGNTPIRDVRTCREKQDAAIADLREEVADIREALHLLRARVAALEARHPSYTAIYDPDPADPPMSTALGGTPGTSYLPGCAMDEYARVADAAYSIHKCPVAYRTADGVREVYVTPPHIIDAAIGSGAYLEAAAVIANPPYNASRVTVPILGDVDSATGAITWRNGEPAVTP